MKIRSEFPDDTPQNLRWHTAKIPRGKIISGWIAGPMVHIKGHFPKGPTKPCLTFLTRGLVDCPWCGLFKRRELSYLPFWANPRLERLVIIVSKTGVQGLKGAKHGDFITATQHEVPGYAAVVKLANDNPGAFSKKKWVMKRPPETIDEYLCKKLWDCPELLGVDLSDNEAA